MFFFFCMKLRHLSSLGSVSFGNFLWLSIIYSQWNISNNSSLLYAIRCLCFWLDVSETNSYARRPASSGSKYIFKASWTWVLPFLLCINCTGLKILFPTEGELSTTEESFSHSVDRWAWLPSRGLSLHLPHKAVTL